MIRIRIPVFTFYKTYEGTVYTSDDDMLVEEDTLAFSIPTDEMSPVDVQHENQFNIPSNKTSSTVGELEQLTIFRTKFEFSSRRELRELVDKLLEHEPYMVQEGIGVLEENSEAYISAVKYATLQSDISGESSALFVPDNAVVYCMEIPLRHMSPYLAQNDNTRITLVPSTRAKVVEIKFYFERERMQLLTDFLRRRA